MVRHVPLNIDTEVGIATAVAAALVLTICIICAALAPDREVDNTEENQP